MFHLVVSKSADAEVGTYNYIVHIYENDLAITTAVFIIPK